MDKKDLEFDKWLDGLRNVEINRLRGLLKARNKRIKRLKEDVWIKDNKIFSLSEDIKFYQQDSEDVRRILR